MLWQVFVMVAISHYMAACSKGSKMLSFKQTKVDVEVKTTADPEGATSAPIESKAVVNQRVNAASGTGIDGSLLVFPPSSVSTSIRVSMSKGQNLTIPEFATAIGAGSFTSNANTLLISSTPALDLAKPIKITLQLPTIAPSNANWAVLFESKHVSENGQYWSGLIPRSALTMTGTSVTFDASYFGSYQLVSTQTLVDTLVQLKGTVAEIAAGQPPSSPTSIVSISTSAIDGLYASGNVISLLVTFNRPVLVNGAASLALNSGGIAYYTGGSGTLALSFSYTVVAAHTSTDLDAASVNALTTTGSINDMYGRAAVLTVPVGSTAGALAFNSNIVIAGSAPSVTSVSASTDNGSYKAGDSITITVTFTTAVSVVGTPQITLETGATDQVVNYTSGSGTATLNFNYTVAPGNTSSDLDYQSVNALALNGGTIKDSSTSIDAILTLPTVGGANSIAGQKAIVVDTTSPVITFTSTSPTSPSSDQTPNIVVSLSEGSATNGLGLFSNAGCTVSIATAVTGVSGSNTVTTSSLTANVTTAIYAKATDVAGNVSSCTSLVSYTHDNTAPTITYTSTSPTSPATSQTPAVTLSLTEATATNGLRLYSDSGCSAVISAAVTGVSGSNTVTTTSLTANATTSIYAKATDAAGNASVCTSLVTYTHDNLVPVITYTSISPTSPGNSQTPSVTLSLSEASANSGLSLYSNAECTVSIATALTGAISNNTITTTPLTANATTSIYAKATDGAGNASSCTSLVSYTHDDVAPTVTNVTSTLANGSYRINQVVPVTVTFSESVTVSGTPRITLATGGGGDVVGYSSGSVGTVLTFDYTVGAGDSSSDLDYTSTSALALNGGTIKDAAGNDATLTLATPGDAASLGANKNIVIDTTDPTITVTSVTTTSPGRSQTPTVQFTLSEAATVTLYSDSGCSTTTISSGTSLASGVRTMTTNSLTANAATTIYGLAADGAGNNSACTTIGTYTNDLTAPGTPTGLTATPTSGQVALTWTASTGSPPGYIVIRHTAAITGGPSDGSNYAVSNAVGNGTVVYAGTTNSFTDTGLTNETTYYYAVRAKDSALNWSAAATADSTPSGGGGVNQTAGAGGNSRERYIFVSSQTMDGLGVGSNPSNGLVLVPSTYGADNLCQSEGTSGTVTNNKLAANWNWNALIGINGSTLRTRMGLPSNVHYKNTNSTPVVVANSEAQLFNDDGQLLSSEIAADHDGNVLGGAISAVWTAGGLSWASAMSGYKSCGDWSVNSAANSAITGNIQNPVSTAVLWWHSAASMACNSQKRVYCINTPPAYIFVTSATYSGDLGGTSGADSKCEERAAAGSITKDLGVTRWRAIVHGNSPYSDISHRQRLSLPFNTKVLLPNNTTFVAGDSSTLFNDSGHLLVNPPNMDENGNTQSSNPWTGNSSNNCNGGSGPWTSSSNSHTGQTGYSGSTTAIWLGQMIVNCDQRRAIYCIGQ